MAQTDLYFQEVLAQLRVGHAETSTHLQHMEARHREAMGRLGGRLSEIEQCIGQLTQMARRVGYGFLTFMLVAVNMDPERAAEFLVRFLDALAR